MDIQSIVQTQKAHFATGATLPYAARMQALRSLKDAVARSEKKIFGALYSDLGKGDFEAYMTEVGIVHEELRFAMKHLKHWMKPRKTPTPLAHFPSKSHIHANPYGVALIMSPWNYPFQLTLAPLAGAIAAGNCVVIKPASYSPATSQVIADLIAECYPPEYITVVQGGRQQNADLLNQKFDNILFTGSIAVGKLVQRSAAENLTPVTLELGGKSPCIVDETANIRLAARRIVFGKFTNAGQTCVAPDYLYVHASKKDELVHYMIDTIHEFFPGNALENPQYPHIVNEKHFDRLLGLTEGANTLYGGASDRASLRIQPTLLDGVTWDSPVMGEEIFGPLFPILTFERMDEVLDAVNAHPHPLALYLFTEDGAVKQYFARQVAFGGGCVNDTLVHLANSNLPFGGVGYSGMGSYHGKTSFDTFTHYKSILTKSNLIDLPIRYLPGSEKKLQALRKFLR